MIIYNNIFQTIAGSTNEPVKVTVEEIKALANAAKLDLNAVYQITDYQINSFAPREDIYNTRGHYFDILVTAYSTNKINMSAAVTKHDGDTYYNEIDLCRWLCNYAIKGITQDFDYDTLEQLQYPSYNNDKGIILYLKDHRNNEAQFDFKNLTINGFLLFDNKNKVDESQIATKNDGVRNTSYMTMPHHFNNLESTQYINIYGNCNNVQISSNAMIIHSNVSTFNINNLTNFIVQGNLTLNSAGTEIYDTQIIDSFNIKIGNGMNLNLQSVQIYNCSNLNIQTYDMRNATFKNLSSKEVSENYTNNDPWKVYTNQADKVTVL